MATHMYIHVCLRDSCLLLWQKVNHSPSNGRKQWDERFRRWDNLLSRSLCERHDVNYKFTFEFSLCLCENWGPAGENWAKLPSMKRYHFVAHKYIYKLAAAFLHVITKIYFDQNYRLSMQNYFLRRIPHNIRCNFVPNCGENRFHRVKP